MELSVKVVCRVVVVVIEETIVVQNVAVEVVMEIDWPAQFTTLQVASTVHGRRKATSKITVFFRCMIRRFTVITTGSAILRT